MCTLEAVITLHLFQKDICADKLAAFHDYNTKTDF